MLAGMFGTSGTPDTYLDYKSDLWCEWKIVPGEDRLSKVLPASAMPTTIQRRWLDRRWRAGGNAVCLVGFKLRGSAHGLVLSNPDMWTHPPLRDMYEPQILSAKSLADYLQRRIS